MCARRKRPPSPNLLSRSRPSLAHSAGSVVGGATGQASGEREGNDAHALSGPARPGAARRSTLSIVGRLSTVGAPFYGRYETLTPRCHHQLADRPTDRTSIPSNNDTVRRSLAAAAISSYCRGPGKIIYGHGGAAAASTSRSRAGNMQIICGPSASVDRPAMMRFDRARLARTRGPTRPSDGLIAAAVSSLQPGPASRIVSYRIAFHSWMLYS